eukprot:UN11547
MSMSIESWSEFCHSIVSLINCCDRMEWCYFLGCMMVSFSAPLALLIFIIAPKPQLIVLAITSSIFYLAAIMINTIIWKLLPFLQSSATIFIMISVLIIETMR